ncbi:sialic acid-binding Ig-like lectin 14 [Clinocottus analis]|uniref:sialic acid-binding Ig-like lectin 14 n=1 Tax=Clinocottus analis TaxID=304258 RepID=UPI0035C21629
MELKLCFSFLLLHVIHVQSSRQWLINVPRKIYALETSCLVIPCIYSIPWRVSTPNLRKRTGLWKIGKKIVATTNYNWQLPKEYKYRSDFLGDLHSLNCTMMLEDVRRTDVGPFYFRIEIDPVKSYSFKKNSVHIDVTSNPTPPSMSVQRMDGMVASCFVTHPCPTNPPKFAWNRPERATRRSNRVNMWLWKTTSILYFSPKPGAFNQTLNCTVHYSGGKQATSSMIIP